MNGGRRRSNVTLTPHRMQGAQVKAQELVCGFCHQHDHLNAERDTDETLLQCSKCDSLAHPECIHPQLTANAYRYLWECEKCKRCSICHRQQEDRDAKDIVLCDSCDRGFHMKCLDLRRVPRDSWWCQQCEELPATQCETVGCDGSGHYNQRSRVHMAQK